MASIAGLSNATGFSRDAISKRKTLFELDDDFDPRDVLDLKPLDEQNANRVTLEQARTIETQLKSEKLEVELQTLRKERIPMEIFNQVLSDTCAVIKAVIEASDLEDKEKQQIFEELENIPSKLKW